MKALMIMIVSRIGNSCWHFKIKQRLRLGWLRGHVFYTSRQRKCVENQRVSERINLLDSTSTQDLETNGLNSYSGKVVTFLHQFHFRLPQTDHLRF